MRPEVRDTVFRLMFPIVGIVVILGVARIRQLALTEDLALRRPPMPKSALWFAAFVVLVALEEVVGPRIGVPLAQPWADLYGPLTKAFRVVGIVLLAPISEELLFRGLLYHVVAATALKDLGAIILTGVAFAALHFQYSPAAMALVLVDGFFYGAARYSTGSIVLTMILHATGNAYAAYQRL